MNLTASYWERYRALGWSVIPILPGSKKPFPISWKKYQSERPNAEQTAVWAKTWPKAGIACVTGAISGVVVLDIDKIPEDAPTAQERALAMLSKSLIERLPTTATTRTSKGRHLYFKHPGTWVPTKVGFLPGLDVRGDGGYALLPPSLHPSGWVYAWELPPEEGIADLPEELLEAIVNSDKYVKALTGGGAVLENSELGTWKSALLGSEEGGRNANATKVIGKLLQNTDTELFELQWGALKEWNQRNTPPLSEKELRITFDSIAKAEREKRKPSKAQIFGVETLANRDLPEVSWAVKNLISGFTLLIAKPKLGKSILALQAAIAITQGTPLFNDSFTTEEGVLDWPTKGGPVLYLDLEDSERRLHDRIKAMTGGYFPHDLYATLKAPTIAEGGIGWLQQQLELYKPRLVIIDMLPTWIGRATSGGKGVYQSEYLTMRLLWELSASTQVPILALQHARKDPVVKGVHPDPFDAANGTLGGPGAADTLIVMQERAVRGPKTIGTKAANLFVRGRDVPEYELALIGNAKSKTWNIVR